MQDLLVLALMSVSSFVPFVALAWLMRKGQVGWSMTIMSLLGAAFVILIYATNHDLGLDPVQAIGLALLVLFPALMGGLAGGLLGWLIRLRRER